jgi:hypothetical protein
VGHSLSGVVLCRYSRRALRAARARGAAGLTPVEPFGAPWRGTSGCGAGRPLVAEELLEPGDPRSWNNERELGVIAGTRPVGLGRFFARFDEPSDGTVALSETKLPGHKAHLAMPVSHMGLLVSGLVARQVAHFLDDGRFID